MNEFIGRTKELIPAGILMDLIVNTGIGKAPIVDNDANPEYIFKLCLVIAELLISEEYHDYQRLIAAKFIDLITKVTNDIPRLLPEEVGGVDRTINNVIEGKVRKLVDWNKLSAGEKRAYYYIAKAHPADLLKTDMVPIPVGMRTEDFETILRYADRGLPVFVGKRIFDSMRKGDGSFNSAYYRAAYSFLSQYVYNQNKGQPTEVIKEKLRKMHSIEPQHPQESDREYVERCCWSQQESARKKPKLQVGDLNHPRRISAKGLPEPISQMTAPLNQELAQGRK